MERLISFWQSLRTKQWGRKSRGKPSDDSDEPTESLSDNGADDEATEDSAPEDEFEAVQGIGEQADDVTPVSWEVEQRPKTGDWAKQALSTTEVYADAEDVDTDVPDDALHEDEQADVADNVETVWDPKRLKRVPIRQDRTVRIWQILSALLAVAVIVLSLTVWLQGRSAKGYHAVYFENPEEGIQWLSGNLRNENFARALNGFAIPEAHADYNFDLVNRNRGTFDARVDYAPPHPSYLELNEARVYGDASMQMTQMVYGFVSALNLEKPYPYVENGTEPIAMHKNLDPRDLRALELLRTDLVYPARQTSQTVSLSDQDTALGYTERQEWVALYRIDGQLYSGAFTLIKNEKGWQFASLGSKLAEREPGKVFKTSEQDYLALTG